MKYRVTIKQNNDEIKKILKGYFDVFYRVVADENRQIRYPISKP